MKYFQCMIIKNLKDGFVELLIRKSKSEESICTTKGLEEPRHYVELIITNNQLF